MLDIDRFKQINDTRGHPAGDEVLKHFAELCRTESRTTDMVARLGGEEFGILLPQTVLAEAEIIAERLRQSVADYAVQLDGEAEPLRFTVSIGLAATGPDVTIEQLISRADRALYRAKQAGRNCIRCAYCSGK
jgi:diguanylate cyclase (GGDEF)-like protein